MQRVIERSARAHRVAVRRAKKQKQHKEAGEAWQRRQQTGIQLQVEHENIREARRNRREDWERGPLAPRRDVGDKTEMYGTMDLNSIRLPEKNPRDRLKWWHIAEGDRVVVMQGRDRGRISVVEEIMEASNAVKVKDVNVVDVKVPEWMAREIGDNRTIVASSRYMPVEHVKLVYPLPDPQTGVPRDVIIDRVEPLFAQTEKIRRKTDRVERRIPGTDLLIPWPEKPDPEYENQDADTLIPQVEEETTRQFLLQTPMPMSVIDELRGKYSRFRTRHDPEYVQRKEEEDSAVERRKTLGKSMRTPLQELAEKRAEERKAEKKTLSREQLARIGEVIAAERMKAKDAVRQMV